MGRDALIMSAADHDEQVVPDYPHLGIDTTTRHSYVTWYDDDDDDRPNIVAWWLATYSRIVFFE
jgi:hypothetical protein